MGLARTGLAHCFWYHTKAASRHKPSAKISGPGCPSLARPQNPASIATRMLAYSSVSLELSGYRPVSFFLTAKTANSSGL